MLVFPPSATFVALGRPWRRSAAAWEDADKEDTACEDPADEDVGCEDPADEGVGCEDPADEDVGCGDPADEDIVQILTRYILSWILTAYVLIS